MGVYCELHSCLSPVSILDRGRIKGVILSGGPFSVYEEGSPHLQDGVLEEMERRGLPILGICYGFQEIVSASGVE
jgi:GMP synthase (glutamine-hydrolysing)